MTLYSLLGYTFEPISIFWSVIENLEERLLSVFHAHKGALGWNMANTKGMDPLVCTFQVALEDDTSPPNEYRLNSAMKKVVKTEVLKLLDAAHIY